MPNHFIAKLTTGGGPPPLEELARILDQADSSPDREAWFGTHKRGADWDSVGICILLAVPTLHAIIAEVIGRSDSMPDEPSTRELYRDRGGFVAWWHVRNPIPVQFESLDAIPGRGCASGRGAAYVFRGQVSFAYWDFGSASFDDLCDGVAIAIPSITVPARPVGAVPPASTLSAADSGCELWPRPELPLYGVDFSGGEEDHRYGNAKIWVAEWSPGKDVALRCGRSTNTTDKICRSDLPTLIRRSPGWWSLDFPFGIAKETACALELSSWPEWLRWCGGARDATSLRNQARDLTSRAGVAWNLRRQVDESHKTTWFPLFEQLYRQTIYGVREVLLPLHDEGVCILPWGSTALRKSAAVVEGFPGATIRDRLLKQRVSYKGSTGAHKTARQAIIKALQTAPFAIPISDNIAAIAIEDNEGDALDALVLLVGSWVATTLSSEKWNQQLARLDRCNATVEGWFPV